MIEEDQPGLLVQVHDSVNDSNNYWDSDADDDENSAAVYS